MSTPPSDAFEARPASLPVWVTTITGLIAVAASATTLPSTALGLLGLVVLAAGVSRGRRRYQTLGSLVLFAGVLWAGVAGTGPLRMLAATGAAVVAWDAGDNAVSLGRQVGSRARTRSAVLVHTGATLAVAVVVGLLSFGVYRVARAGQPTTAVVLLLVAAVLFTVLLDR